MKILIINGAIRKNGNTDKIIESFKKIAVEENFIVNELVLRDVEIKLCDGCIDCANSLSCPNTKDEFSGKYLLQIWDNDIYIFATPVYCDNATPLLVNFIDRILSQTDNLKGKKIGVIVHGMADTESWKFPIMWIEGMCKWLEAKFIGSLTFKSGAEPNTAEINEEKIKSFLRLI